MTRTMTSNAAGSGVSTSSSCMASFGSPSRSLRITHAAIVLGSWPRSVFRGAVRLMSSATEVLGYSETLSTTPTMLGASTSPEPYRQERRFGVSVCSAGGAGERQLHHGGRCLAAPELRARLCRDPHERQRDQSEHPRARHGVHLSDGFVAQ